MIKHVKRSTVLLFIFAIVFTTGLVTFAISSLFSHLGAQKSGAVKNEFIEFADHKFFPVTEEKIRPGDTLTCDTVLTLDSSKDMWVFIFITEPIYSSSALYTFTPGSDWTLLGESTGEQYKAVYRFNEPVAGNGTTTALTSGLTMVDMSRVDYGELEDINVEMDAFAVGTEDTDAESAWNAIKSECGF